MLESCSEPYLVVWLVNVELYAELLGHGDHGSGLLSVTTDSGRFAVGGCRVPGRRRYIRSNHFLQCVQNIYVVQNHVCTVSGEFMITLTLNKGGQGLNRRRRGRREKPVLGGVLNKPVLRDGLDSSGSTRWAGDITGLE